MFYSQQFLYALTPFLDPDTQFQSTLIFDAISEISMQQVFLL